MMFTGGFDEEAFSEEVFGRTDDFDSAAGRGRNGGQGCLPQVWHCRAGLLFPLWVTRYKPISPKNFAG
jgi:hypothetical protein